MNCSKSSFRENNPKTFSDFLRLAGMKSGRKVLEYTKYYSEAGLARKLKKLSGLLGSKLLYYVLLLFVLISDKTIPPKVRMVFIAALGYFILPTDLVADFLPVIGFTDDIAFLTYAISNATEYITPEITEKAKRKHSQILGKEDLVEDTDREERA